MNTTYTLPDSNVTVEFPRSRQLNPYQRIREVAKVVSAQTGIPQRDLMARAILVTEMAKVVERYYITDTYHDGDAQLWDTDEVVELVKEIFAL